jgi:hypothetical protein
MAIVTLEEPDREGSVLPDVCMKCGRPVTDRVLVSFLKIPRWMTVVAVVGLLLGPLYLGLTLCAFFPVLLALFVRSRFTLMRATFRAPLCAVHRKRLLARFWGLPVAAAVLLVVLVFGIKTADTDHTVSRGIGESEFIKATPLQKLADKLAFVAFLGLLSIPAALLFLRRVHRPRVVRITDFTTTLAGVDPKFVQAYEDSQRPVPLVHGVGERWGDRTPGAGRGDAGAPPHDQIQQRPGG